MLELDLKIDPIALWGTIIATALAIREFRKSFTKLEVSKNFTTNDEIGNEVIIRNLTNSEITITHWELVWRRKIFLKWFSYENISPDEFNKDIKIASKSSKTLIFKDGRCFDWSIASLGDKKIYLKLFLAGSSKPKFYKIYG